MGLTVNTVPHDIRGLTWAAKCAYIRAYEKAMSEGSLPMAAHRLAKAVAFDYREDAPKPVETTPATAEEDEPVLADLGGEQAPGIEVTAPGKRKRKGGRS
jgi:hypothetical protein